MMGCILLHQRSHFYGWQQQSRLWQTAVATMTPFLIQFVIKPSSVVPSSSSSHASNSIWLHHKSPESLMVNSVLDNGYENFEAA
jgi:hypothetical protein